jgi:hypothetical protein
VSHSPDWSSTLLIVVEDDPQGTADVKSAYRRSLRWPAPGSSRATSASSRTACHASPARSTASPGSTPDRQHRDMQPDDRHVHQRGRPHAHHGGHVRGHDVPVSRRSRASRRPSDPEHGIYSFTLPDAIDPALAPLRRRGLRVQIGREMGGALHASAHRDATRDIPGRPLPCDPGRPALTVGDPHSLGGLIDCDGRHQQQRREAR